MVRAIIVLSFLLSATALQAEDQKKPSYPSFRYDIARAHEVKRYRHTIPHEGIETGFDNHQLRLKLIVSPIGDVISSEAFGDETTLRFWPELQGEVSQWRFTPFEENGKAVTAQVTDFLDLVPPERLPKIHVAPPVLHPNSDVTITLRRGRCIGYCRAYTVAVSTTGIVFDGGFSVVAAGKHTGKADPDEVRKLAKKFIAADFYSMEPMYSSGASDLQGYSISIAIDGHTKGVADFEGQQVGMPAVITDLEEEVDALAQRWVSGSEGLVKALQTENFNFHTFDAQVILKAAAREGQTTTVTELLQAGVSLEPLPAPKLGDPYTELRDSYIGVRFENLGWLNAASHHPETLQVLIAAGASKNDQNDKDFALTGAAQSGQATAVRALIAYGANPNADLSSYLLKIHEPGGMTPGGPGPGMGSVLIYAALSGNPEVINEILRHHPNLETRDPQGETAMFAAAEYGSTDEEDARVECVRILANAGANINPRDNNGNTPLHITSFHTGVLEELLKLGAEVNARNKDGDTPISTMFNDDAVPLFIQYGADLTIRNNKGETVLEAAKRHGPSREYAIRKAIQNLNQQ